MTKPIWVFDGPASKKIIFVPDEVADQPAEEGWGQRIGTAKLTSANPPGRHKKAEAFLAKYGPAPYRTSELRPEANPPVEQTPTPPPPTQETPAPETEPETVEQEEIESDEDETSAPQKTTRKRRR